MRQRFRFGAVAMMIAMAFAGMTGSYSSVAAQDATPVSVECVSPGLPPGTPTPMDDMDMASPEAMEGEMEEAPAPPEGEPADEETAAAIIAALENYGACYNAGQAAGDPGLYVALETERYITEVQGFPTAYDRAASDISDPPSQVTIASITNPMIHEDGRVSADIVLLMNDVFAFSLRSVFAEEDGVWKYDDEFELPVDPGTVGDTVSVNGVSIGMVADDATGEEAPGISLLGGGSGPENVVTVFNVSNNLDTFVFLALVQLPEGMTAADMAAAGEEAEGVLWLGWGEVGPGETTDMVFANLPAGNYALVAGDDAGTMMATDFTVVAAEG